MKRAIGLSAAAAAAMWLVSVPAHAGTITFQTFDVNPVLGATQAANTWYSDRYAPAGFSSQFFAGDNRLALTVSTADSAANRPPAFSSSFYNTQGRKFDTAGANFMSVDMYIASSFQGIGAADRIGGLWATGMNLLNATTSFPIIEFFDNQFQGWDDGSGWVALGLPTGFSYDKFHTLSFVLDLVANQVLYTVDGQLLGTVSAYGTTQFGNGILQGRNPGQGVDRTIYFDNFVAAETPVPGAVWLFGSVLAGGIGLARHRRRRQSVTA